jgi:hypothetical protein
MSSKMFSIWGDVPVDNRRMLEHAEVSLDAVVETFTGNLNCKNTPERAVAPRDEVRIG